MFSTQPLSATRHYVRVAALVGCSISAIATVTGEGHARTAPPQNGAQLVGNFPPTVDAGPDQTVTGNVNVSLNGSASDADGDPLTYQWSQTAGPGVTLTGDTTLTPSFVSPARQRPQQTMTFQLVANDGTSNSQPDQVNIIIPANQPPSADAGTAQNVSGRSSVTLDGSGSSDPDGDPLVYIWTQVSGPSVALTGANTAAPSFVAPAGASATQTLEFQLLVADSFDDSDTERVTVTIAPNQLPVADAGADQTVSGNSTVTLDATGSTDPEGDPINYSWVQLTGPNVTLNNPNSANPSFTAPPGMTAQQDLTFRLTVNDDSSGSGSGGSRIAPPTAQQDEVRISILPNSPPIADAGVDQGPIDSGQTVTMDGSGSSDPDNDALTYAWTQVSGTPVSLTGGNSASPTFVAPLVNGNEDLVFSLTVSDGQASSTADTVTVGIRAIGTITIVQRVTGSDTTVAFTSDVATLNGSITTSGGSGQLSAAGVSAGSYSVTAADLSSVGYAVTDISCNDSDSVVNLSGRSVALALSPNEDLVCTFTSVNSREAAATAINNFLTGRNALILAHQPDLQRRIDRLQGSPGSAGSATAYGLPVPGSGKLPFNATFSAGQGFVKTSLATVRAATGDPQDRGSSPFDIWAEAYFASARLGSQRGNFRIIHTGADYRIGKDLLVGVLGEFDDFSNKGPLAAGEAEGNGWMAGPYVMARLAPDLYGELRAAWGKSDNRINPLGTYIDSFDTSRSLYSGSLIGQFDIGSNTDFRPEATIRYIGETQKAYIDSLGIAIPEQKVDQGDFSFRPRIQHRIKLEDGWSLRPYGEIEGIYTFGTSQNSILENGLRARIEGGLDIFSSGGFRASISAFHDGIGTSNYRSTGGHLSVSFGF